MQGLALRTFISVIAGSWEGINSGCTCLFLILSLSILCSEFLFCSSSLMAVESGGIFVFSRVRWVFHEGGIIFDHRVAFRAVPGALQTWNNQLRNCECALVQPGSLLKGAQHCEVSPSSHLGAKSFQVENSSWHFLDIQCGEILTRAGQGDGVPIPYWFPCHCAWSKELGATVQLKLSAGVIDQKLPPNSVRNASPFKKAQDL